MPQSALLGRILNGSSGHKTIKAVNEFLATPYYIISVSLLSLLLGMLGKELILYTVFIVIAAYVCLAGKDLLPLMPLFALSYISPSPENNPGRNEESIFYLDYGGRYLILLFVLFLLCLVLRLVYDNKLGARNFLKSERKLNSGMLLLGAAYLLSGAFSGRYFEHGASNLIFSILQFSSIFLLYWLFTGTVDWSKTRKDYFAWIGFSVGIVVCAQLAIIIYERDALLQGSIVASRIFSGWGNTNNIGCIIAMMIPFAFQHCGNSRFGWLFGICAMLMTVAVCFTCSRTSIAAAICIFFLSALISLRFSDRRKNVLLSLALGIGVGVFFLLFSENTAVLFSDLVEKGLDPSSRDVIYNEGIYAFRHHPIFGDTFYPESMTINEWHTVKGFSLILPNRWHNTIIQLLASCGLIGLFAYILHRLQTARIFLKKRNTDAVYIAMSILALLAMSMLDCHMFNIGPVLIYSMALAFAEKCKF